MLFFDRNYPTCLRCTERTTWLNRSEELEEESEPRATVRRAKMNSAKASNRNKVGDCYSFKTVISETEVI